MVALLFIAVDYADGRPFLIMGVEIMDYEQEIDKFAERVTQPATTYATRQNEGIMGTKQKRWTKA